MTDLDRKHLAAAYMAAWYAVKKTPCQVSPEPNGWFLKTLSPGRAPGRRVRASDIIKGLAVLAGRLEFNAKE